ncbi:hypothetical protein KY290_025183 [Solanum tuberosum]|uniref:Uncharacterized protein n=1 Tax=Solanum tuberosum TaxID=4113 RepID=A0ABQ7UUW3_SOLTU|nr:hypothetical protein KY284_023987 [Solanum tuberosum]KAH0754913.1 hypothetical protein KY290_025183 [Solanum tuberosum]
MFNSPISTLLLRPVSTTNLNSRKDILTCGISPLNNYLIVSSQTCHSSKVFAENPQGEAIDAYDNAFTKLLDVAYARAR